MLSTGFLYSDHDATKVLVEYTLNYEANRVPSAYGNFSSKEYVYLPNPQTGVLTPAAMLKQSNAGLEVFYLMPDQLGSIQTVVQVRNVVDATGQAVNNTAFVAYSTAQGDSKVFYRDDFSKNGGFNLRAPGQYLDIETGLLYNNARYFNPWIGAFISADPIGKNGGTNVYAYGVGSLINDVDDNGFQTITRPVCNSIACLAVSVLSSIVVIQNSKQGTLSNANTTANTLPNYCPPRLIIRIPSNYPETSLHVREALDAGHSAIGTIDRNPLNKKARRDAALASYPTKPGYDRDEFPMAMFVEGGAGASVKYINPSDNRGAGAWVGAQCTPIPDGCQVEFRR